MGNAGVTAALILVAIAVLMQAGAMLGILLVTRKMVAQVEKARSDVMARLDPLTQSAQEIVNGSREPLHTIAVNLAEISRMLRARTAEADALASDVLDKTRLQVARVDQMVADLVERVNTTADYVQQGVFRPLREIAAVTKGVRSGLEFLLHRRVTNVSEATQDEQMFI